MTTIAFKILPDLKTLFEKKCGPVPISKILRGLIRAFVNGQITIDDLDLSDE